MRKPRKHTGDLETHELTLRVGNWGAKSHSYNHDGRTHHMLEIYTLGDEYWKYKFTMRTDDKDLIALLNQAKEREGLR